MKIEDNYPPPGAGVEKMPEQNITALKMLWEHEKELAKLYYVFSERYEEFRGFWKARGDEVRAFADSIQWLIDKISAGLLILNDNQFKIIEIKYSLKKLKGQVAYCAKYEMPPSFAFSFANEAIMNMAVKHILEANVTGTDEFKNWVDNLQKKAQSHVDSFKAEFKKR